MDCIKDIDLLEIIPLLVLSAAQNAIPSRIPRNTGLPGGEYLEELLECGNDKRIYLVLRIKKETFKSLCLWLRENAGLTDSRYIMLEEQIAMFL
jgi:hypothetical protein